MVSWTTSQRQAIEARGSNLLVAAGAGSGKTAVLIQRILGRILDPKDPVDVDRLLIVTYTNAAAVEMRHRLAKALYQAVAGNPNNRHLARQPVLLQRAQITTLHAFCLDTIKKYFYLLDLDPKARIGNRAELLLLREGVLDKAFEANYGQENSGLELLLKHYSRGVGDDNIKKLVLQIADFSYSMADPKGWLDGLAIPYKEGAIAPWLDYIYAYLQQELQNAADLLKKAARLSANPALGLSPYLVVIDSEAQAAEAVANHKLSHPLKDWDSFIELLESVEFKRLPSISKKAVYDEGAKNQAAAWRNQAKEAIRKIQKVYAGKNLAAIQGEIAILQPLAVGLLELTADYLQAWQTKKRQKKLLEFGDLEHYCLELLQNQAAAADLKAQFAEVFVDEYQDINQVQESILAGVSQADNRFMVGDIKQSIYRFRMAEPTLFLDKFEDYGQGKGGMRIDLQQNFRSQPQVLDAVNFVFGQLMTGGNTEIVYDSSAELLTGNGDYTPLATELLILDQEAINQASAANFDQENLETTENEAQATLGEDVDNEIAPFDEAFTVAAKEAEVIGRRILELKAEGRSYNDIVILLRSVKTWSGLVKNQLQAMSIPCRADGVDNYYETAEIQTILSLLKIIDNPLQEIEFAAALHSPAVGLTLAELGDLRLLSNKSFYEAAILSSHPAIQDFLAKYESWRLLSNQGSVADLLTAVYNDTGILQIMGALPDGTLRRSNLQSFWRLAKDYDLDNYKGLYRFLVFVERNATEGQTTAPAADPGEGVTIMSIHRSKGLEFPVVFVAGLGKKFNEEDTKKDVLLHRHLGLGMRLVDLPKRIKYPTLGYSVLANKVSWETKAEELRILYVALTRAKEHLILVGTAKSIAKLWDKAAPVLGLPNGEIPTALVGQANNYLAWLVLALVRHPAAQKHLADCNLFCDQPLATASQWQIKIISQGQNLPIETAATTNQSQIWQDFAAGKPVLAGQIEPEIMAKLGWQYPNRPLTVLPAKWSATALAALSRQDLLSGADNQTIANVGEIIKEEIISDEIINIEESINKKSINIEDLPNSQNQAEQERFAKRKRPTGFYADLGTANHLLLEKVDLSALVAGADPKAQMAQVLAKAVENGVVDPEVAKAVNLNKISGFWQSPLGQMLLKAQATGQLICRELAFTLSLSLAELCQLDLGFAKEYGATAKAYPDAKVFFQGVIDLAFKTEEGWILVDYKSGVNAGLSDQEVESKYGSQLNLYEQAIAKICGQPVGAKYIYFTLNNRSVKIEL